MNLVLDTSALYDPTFVETLAQVYGLGVSARGRLTVIVPAFVYAERRRQLRRDGRPVAGFQEALAVIGAVVEPFTVAEAQRLSPVADADALWERHARDFLIAAHVHGDRLGVTTDAGPAWRHLHVLTPSEATAAVRELAT